MNSASKQELKSRIEAEIITVENDIERLKELTSPIAPENAIGRVSRMDAINNKSVNEAALRKAQARHRGLLSALEKNKDEGFGLCRGCGSEIPLGRLLLLPESTHCVRCASR